MTRKWIELVFNFNMGSLQIWLNIGFEVCTLDKPIKQHDYIPLGLFLQMFNFYDLSM